MQVEHTVTEMVTGIDIVRSQIQVAQGHELHGPEMRLPQQDEIPLHGYALQCRVTTEDPANRFMPDYGKIHTYRSPAGFGIRLDGASAYGGAVITPYYDSLLVKVTAWGQDFEQACQRMDRALARVPHPRRDDEHSVPRERRESRRLPGRRQRPRGSSTKRRSCSSSRARKDRATKLLTYLGETDRQRQ